MSILADASDRIESIGRPRPAAELPHPWLPNGVATITFPCGTHKTLKVHTQRGGIHAGKRLISLLIGPNNSEDFEPIGELVPPGVWVWKAFKGKRSGDYAELFFSLAKGEKLEGHELMMSRNCLRCNRPLTHPESITDNIGPECKKREAKRS